MIKEWLHEVYNPSDKDEALQALREIMQEVALSGLYRSGFFEKAAFYGDTALRIFYGLNRYSEDLDFSLLQPDESFSLEKYLAAVQNEFESQGMKGSIRGKEKTNKGAIDSAFLKSETLWRELVPEGVIPQNGLGQVAGIKIKLEIDTQPPLNFATGEKLLLRPFSLYVKCFSITDLFAGKMHALLFRKWKDNVKGRDWYDMEWYIRKGTPLHLQHFLTRAKNSGDWKKDTITEPELITLLNEKIDQVDMKRIKDDIQRFIPDPQVLDIWSKHYFHELVKNLKTT